MTARILAFQPRFIDKCIEMALAADESGDVDTALEHVRAALGIDPKDARANALAALYSALLDLDQPALVHASVAMEHQPVSSEVAYWSGVARHITGAYQLALESFDIAMSLDPQNGDAQELAARCRKRLA